jgi:hypothetical protein
MHADQAAAFGVQLKGSDGGSAGDDAACWAATLSGGCVAWARKL